MHDTGDRHGREPGHTADALVRRRAGLIVADWQSTCPGAREVDGTAVIDTVIDGLARCAGNDPTGRHVHVGVAELFDGADGLLRSLDGNAVTCLREVIRRQVLRGLPPRDALLALHCLSTVLDELVRHIAEAKASRLEVFAYLDSLTGLANRRAADDGVRAALAAALRHQRPLSAVVIDLDHLKTTNDQFGHEAGDLAIRGLADALRLALRDEDLAYRTGGDEFLVLMPDSEGSDVDAAMERVAAAGAPAFSYGAAVAPVEATTEDALLRLADHRLLASRRAARGLPPIDAAAAPKAKHTTRRHAAVVAACAVLVAMVLAPRLGELTAGHAALITAPVAGIVAATLAALVLLGRRHHARLLAVLGSWTIGFAAAAAALLVTQVSFAGTEPPMQRAPVPDGMTATSASAAFPASITTPTTAAAARPRQGSPAPAGGQATGAAGAAELAPTTSVPWPTMPAPDEERVATTTTSAPTTTTSTEPAPTTSTTASPTASTTTTSPTTTTTTTSPTTSTTTRPTTTTAPPATTSTTTTDRPPSSSRKANGGLRVRDDHVRSSSSSIDIDVLANDVGGASGLDVSTLEITVSPETGRAKVRKGKIRYHGDGKTDARFRYRVCNQAGSCALGWVTVTYDPPPRSDSAETTPSS
jgi:diguanylate cyclase (GGDEF)-like protein